MKISESTKVILPLQSSFLDYPDNISQAMIVYFLGCSHACKNCYNVDFTNYSSSKGIIVTVEELYLELLKFAQIQRTKKLVFSGGDSLFEKNINFTRQFLYNYGGIFDICIYTGHSIDYVRREGIRNFEFIKCEKYIEDLKVQSTKTDEYMQFSSTNQKLYNRALKLVSNEGRYYFN